MDVLVYLILGGGLGVLTSVPIGVANTAVVEAAVRGNRRRALGVGAGGATADVVHAAIAFAGLAPLIDTSGSWPGILLVASGLAIIGFGIHVACARPAASRDRTAGGFGLGLLLTIANPAAFLAWVVVAGAIGPSNEMLGVAMALGVAVGAFAWFAVLASLAHRRSGLAAARSRRVGQVLGAVLIALGTVSLFRGVQSLLG